MKVFVIAGEPSGDKLGAALMEGLTTEVGAISWDGIGGPLMEGQGLTSLFPMQELSLMGIAEILPKYRHLKRRIRETAEAVIATKPDVLITIDSPDFCLRVARLVKAASDIRTVHYVAPTVWAWRAGRAAKMAQVIDQVLALFPFEPPYMEAAGMRCDFVGHPIAAETPVSDAEIVAFRDKRGLSAGQPALAILPGSRRGEVERMAPRFAEALQQARLGGVQMIVPTLPHLRDTVAKHLGPTVSGDPGGVIFDGAGLSPERAARERMVAMAAADMALATSGTVSLELAAAATPMVIAYDMNWLSRQIISRMLLTDTVTLVNLVSETRTVPEFIGDACRPAAIADGLAKVWAEVGTGEVGSGQQAALALTMERLGRGGPAPGLRAARAVLDGLKRSS